MKTPLLFTLLFVSTLSFGASEIYRLLEDPKKGPEILKDWKIQDRMSDDRWMGIVGPYIEVPYVVKPGDSLSKISKALLGTTDYWPKLWEVNKEKISNPHVIEPHQTIIFSVPRDLMRKLANEEPKSKKSVQSTEFGGQLFRPEMIQKHQLRYFVLENEEILGVITGSYQPNTHLGPGSVVQLGAFDKTKVVIGKTYRVIREVSGSELGTATKKVGFSGTLIQVVGEIRIDGYGDDLARASVLRAQSGVERGDRIIEMESLDLQKSPIETPPNVFARVLIGDNLTGSFFSRGQFVLLDKGMDGGMSDGYLFGAFQDTDPVFQTQKLVEPQSKGQIKLVKVGKTYSVGYIVSNQEPIQVGDILLPTQYLPNVKENFGVSKKNSFID